MRQRNFHRFCILLAGLLLSLHTLVPHMHLAGRAAVADLSLETPAQDAGNIFGFLQTLVGSNLGQGHLEHFVQDHELPGTSTEIAPAAAPPVLPLANFAPYSLPVALRRQRVFLHHLFPPDGRFDAPTALRGPPARA